MPRKSTSALLIFTRNPELGKCKTRLAATVGEQAALEIYIYLLKHTAAICTEAKGADKYVYFSEKLGEGTLWDPLQFQFKVQEGNGLGERMNNAFSRAFREGYQKVVIIGSDLLDLSSEDIETAFEKLDENEIVIGPASDGGYYLLGMKTLHPGLFQGKDWGSDSVLKDTLEDLREIDYFLLPVRNDIDRYEDISGRPEFKPYLKTH
ncbi:TIGR04282 family arsenosugar biosynthesis glycosyltransferase [Robiginitalea sp. IMCC43444]|uniref:TIGR04282 family arsenosugar biosynthesis glycosyltransferase n=1 Tax=Robiginitalea sp. IMCC43444 TaxID=3459121 RepID=UPI0040430741